MGNSPSQRDIKDIINADDSDFCAEDSADVDDYSTPTSSRFPSDPGPMSTQRRRLTFHAVHGDNVRLAKQDRVAKRYESFCKGLAFSARPVEVDEIVVMKLAETTTNWSGVLRFGVTNTDPHTLASDLPKYACPDLTNKEGSWAKALTERFCQQGNIVHFYVRSNGEMYYGVNGVQKGLFLSGINCELPLYVLLDIYGNSTAVEFLEPSEAPVFRKSGRATERRAATNVSPPAVRHGSVGATAAGNLAQPIRSPQPLAASSASTAAQPSSSFSSVASTSAAPPPAVAPRQPNGERAVGGVAPKPTAATTTVRYPPLRFNNGIEIRSLEFHDVCGRNVKLSNDKVMASRNENEYSNGYVFLKRPLNINEKVIIQVLNVIPQYNNSLAFGLTSCEPIRLAAASLPDDSDNLMDRPEYWIVNKDVAGNPLELDELSFYINSRGEVYFQRNNFSPRLIVFVDHTQKLWPFFDLFGKTQKIRLVGVSDTSESRVNVVPMTGNNWSTPVAGQQQIVHCPPLPPAQGFFPPLSQLQQQQLHVHLPPQFQQQARNGGHAPTASTCGAPMIPNAAPPSFAFSRPLRFSRPPPTMVGSAPNAAQPPAPPHFPPPPRPGVAFLGPTTAPPPSLTLMRSGVPPRPPTAYRSKTAPPPPPSSPRFRPQSPRFQAAANGDVPPAPSGSEISAPNQASQTRPEVDSGADADTVALAQRLHDSANVSCVASSSDVKKAAPSEEPKEECVVCMRDEINCVLYTCGHYCMCYECARTTWSKHGFCPICRQAIKDVIKTYKAA